MSTAEKNRKRISQHQIAKDLGVSQTLVSMVLNGRKDGIAKKSVERIWDYAHKHGYAPRGMRIDMGQFKQVPQLQGVGYILRAPLKLATNSTFFSHAHQGLHEALREEAAKTLFLGGEDDLRAETPERLSKLCAGLKGIVILGEVARDLVLSLASLEIPIVTISARYSGLCHSILPNDLQAGRDLVNHLVDLGHRDFAWLGGNRKLARHGERCNAVEQALQEHALSLHPANSNSAEFADRLDGYRFAEAILEGKEGPRPTALVCFNGLIARGAIDYLLAKGIRTGKDVSVVAFDATGICQESHPTITSSSSSPEAMGHAAVQLILNTDPASSKLGIFTDQTLPSILQIRESSGPVAEATEDATTKAV